MFICLLFHLFYTGVVTSYNNPTDYIPPGREQWEAEKVKHRENWFDGFQMITGMRLDGGCWDRPTLLGVFASLDEAIACARLEVV